MIANDITEVKMVGSIAEMKSGVSFRPSYLHQVFREDETIEGYKGLQIYIYILIGSLIVYVDY